MSLSLFFLKSVLDSFRRISYPFGNKGISNIPICSFFLFAKTNSNWIIAFSLSLSVTYSFNEKIFTLKSLSWLNEIISLPVDYTSKESNSYKFFLSKSLRTFGGSKNLIKHPIVFLLRE